MASTVDKAGVKVFVKGMTLSIPEDLFFKFISPLCGVSAEALKSLAVTEVEHLDAKSLVFTLEH